MKKILLIIFVIILMYGCIDNTPKCSDKDVKELALELSREQLIEARSILSKYVDIDKFNTLLENLEKEESDETDLFWAMLQLGDTAKYLQKEGYSDDDIKIIFELAEYDINKLQKTNAVLEEIMATNINKSIKKCSCTGTVKFNELGIGMDIVYYAQVTDDKNQLYVTLTDFDFKDIPKQEPAPKKYSTKQNKENVQRATNDIKTIMSAVYMYRMENGKYPTTEQGLQALFKKPTIEPIPKNWAPQGYLVTNSIPKDPWGNDYIYKCPAESVDADFEIYSLGADGKEGGEGYNADIHSKFLAW